VNGSLGGLLLRMVVSLAVVLALLWVAARVLAGRTGGLPRGRRSGRPAAPVEVLSRAALGRTASVAVVRTCGRTLVVGVSGQQLTVLASDDAPLELQQPPEPPSSPSGRTPLATGWKPVLDALRERTVRRQ
jgi:flagellar biogenesis protein FliO